MKNRFFISFLFLLGTIISFYIAHTFFNAWHLIWGLNDVWNFVGIHLQAQKFNHWWNQYFFICLYLFFAVLSVYLSWHFLFYLIGDRENDE